MTSKKRLAASILVIVLALGGCGKGNTGEPSPTNGADPSRDISSSPAITQPAPTNTPLVTEGGYIAVTGDRDYTGKELKKEVIVYYPNWYLGSKKASEGGEVGSIDWESVTIINHAFFAPFPAGAETESSFDRKKNGLSARTEFKCVSTNESADFNDQKKSELNDEPRNHFAQYAVYAEKYPDVKIMISVGGWSRSGFFSEMVYTKEGRQSFIESLVELMKKHTFISGIDIDWEYPAGSKDGQRNPEGPGDEGCPIWDTAAGDNENFAYLLSEMRDSFDKEFGEGEKLITACASASTSWTLECQDWEAFAPHLDYINIMSYDLTGAWAGVAGHHTPANLTKNAVTYFINKSIPAAKLNIGSPMYPIWMKLASEVSVKNVVGAKVDSKAYMNLSITDTTHTQRFEHESVVGYTYSVVDGQVKIVEKYDNSYGGTVKGWNAGFDEKAGAAYLYNNDSSSPYYKWYATYENPLSLQKKVDLINEYDLAGIIVWESTQDTENHLMVGLMKSLMSTQAEINMNTRQ